MCHVNLIPLNPVAESPYQPSTDANAHAFQRILEKSGIPATVRLRRGIDIDAGCGQLRRRVGRDDGIAVGARRRAQPAPRPPHVTPITSSPCWCCSSNTPSRNRTGSGTRYRPSTRGRSSRSGQVWCVQTPPRTQFCPSRLVYAWYVSPSPLARYGDAQPGPVAGRADDGVAVARVPLGHRAPLPWQTPSAGSPSSRTARSLTKLSSSP